MHSFTQCHLSDRSFFFSLPLLAMITLGVGCGKKTEDVSALAATNITITSLSNRADLISGGDALIEVKISVGLKEEKLKISVNEADVTERFSQQGGNVLVGLVESLTEGENSVVATFGEKSSRLTIKNHSKGGPIFSGRQIQPWICASPEATEGDDNNPAIVKSGLSSAAIDEKCNTKSEISFYYRTTEKCGRSPENPRQVIPCFKPYDTKATEKPNDIASFTTTESVTGESTTIPYVVRVERGAINRGIYDIAVVTDMSEGFSVWNKKLVHIFGGSTGTPRRQMPPNSSWQNDDVLSRGFMVSVSSLTDQALNANKVVAAETVMMIKEHVNEQYGLIKNTIGSGCSGGSIMQLVIAGTYPGILDGIQPACTYPDSHTTSMEVTDCVLLENYFDSTEFKVLTSDLNEADINKKRASIAGHLNEKACMAWSRSFGHSNNPGNFERNGQEVNNCKLPKNWVYDKESNPEGVRCSQPDHEKALWGNEPEETFARRYADNTGVEYGLKAFNDGEINTEEFVTLNENIGGSDIDRGLTKERMNANKDSVAIAYQIGLVTDPRQWAKTPIIDLRGNDNSGIHMNWRAFAVRDRLDRVLGHHDNQIIWRYGPGLLPPKHLAGESLETIDAWVSAIKADTSDDSVEEKVIKNKPKNAVDFCYIGDDYQTKVTDFSICDADPVLAYYQSPRQIAGGPLAENILKCELKSLDRKSYSEEFTDSQWQRMEAIFPKGVCDWTKPGVGVQPATPWLDYSDGPVGKAMPSKPVSESI
ncbi:MAG: hypothetical protein K6L75_11490 [Cellvibrionaceae bacterium]